MDLRTWTQLLGKSQDDAAVKAALEEAGIKKAPKLAKDNVSLIVDLKGYGMWLKLIDEAFFKKLEDQDIGEGPLILTSVGAYIERKKNKDLYKGQLPDKLTPGMTRDNVWKAIGKPSSSDESIPFDSWSSDGLQFGVGYNGELKLAHVNFTLDS
jgi:hypothetical protein